VIAIFVFYLFAPYKVVALNFLAHLCNAKIFFLDLLNFLYNFCFFPPCIYCYRDSWKSNNYMRSNREKKPWTNLQNWYRNEAKWLRATTFAISIPIGKNYISIVNQNYFTFQGHQKYFHRLYTYLTLTVLVMLYNI
jgi:hypothetical protein